MEFVTFQREGSGPVFESIIESDGEYLLRSAEKENRWREAVQSGEEVYYTHYDEICAGGGRWKEQFISLYFTEDFAENPQ